MASYERRDGPTPCGGDYSEIYYLDKDWNSVDADDACRCMIHECRSDGTLLKETIGIVNNRFD